MNQQDFDARVGVAWEVLQAGDHRAAIAEFEQLVAEDPDHIDAQWGLGLAYRHAGDFENALRVFERVKALVDAELAQHPEEHGRWFILNRMVRQQIAQLTDFAQ